MARGQRRQDNSSSPRKDKDGTVDRQMVVPYNYENFRFPVVSANPKRRELNPEERASHENKFDDAPKIIYGRSRQSRY